MQQRLQSLEQWTKKSVERIEGSIARVSEELANRVGADGPDYPKEAVESFIYEEAHRLVESKGDILNKELNSTLDENC